MIKVWYEYLVQSDRLRLTIRLKFGADHSVALSGLFITAQGLDNK